MTGIFLFYLKFSYIWRERHGLWDVYWRFDYTSDFCTGNGSYGQYGATMSAYAHQTPQYACEPNWAAVRYAGMLNSLYPFKTT